MKKIIRKIVASKIELVLEQILYNGVGFLGFLGSVTVTIMNFIYNQHVAMISSALLAINLCVIFYLSRYRRVYFFLGSYVVSLLIAILIYFLCNGIHGPIIIVFLIILVLSLAFNPVKMHTKILKIQLILLTILFLVEFFFPSLILNPYKTEAALHGNLVITFYIGVFMMFICIFFLRRRFDDEREKTLLQKELIKKHSDQKSLFFINLSHEIKTPLTLVENYLEKYIARKGEDNELIIMRQNVQKMRRDILAYLNFENLERGHVSLDKLDVILLDEILAEKILLFKTYAENRNIMLRHSIQPEIYIKINIQSIDQILNNLLENAVKYTPANYEINVSLSIKQGQAKLVVRNTGTFIPEDQLPLLYEPFYQMSHEKLNAQGIGMGLYTVKKILDVSGGHIEVSSSEATGVVFSVMLPVSDEHQTTILSEIRDVSLNLNSMVPKTTDSTFLTNRRSLLLVEDNSELLHYLSEELSLTYNIFVAENGFVALEKLKNIPVPNLIVSDIMMDKVDGYELLERTLQDTRLRHVPFIFLTAKSKSEEKITSLDLGVLDYITKPFSLEEIKAKIRTIIEYKSRISEASAFEIKNQVAENHFLMARVKDESVPEENVLKYQLTPREIEIIAHIQQGLTYDEIGKKLYISENTVTRHVQNIYKKTASTTKIDMLKKVFV